MKKNHVAIAATVTAIGIAWGVLSMPQARPAWLPSDKLTPGAVIAGVSREQTCDPAWTHRSRVVPESLRLAVFRRYGIDPPTSADRQANELDHRIPVALGGASTIDNIWVEPWEGIWGAHTKDRLEYRLWKLVCTGKIPLSEAQAVFRGDWRDAYPKYLGDPTAVRMGADDEGDTEGFPITPRRP